MCAVAIGSASGLGPAAAIAFTRGGARVIIDYRSSTLEVEETADICRGADAPAMVVQADIANHDADCRKLAATASEWGRLDVLINNASATTSVANPANLDALSAEEVQRLYGITRSARSK